MPVQGITYSRFGLGSKMQGKSSVCRCLFGQPNHDDLRKDLDAQLKSTNMEFKSTWNYDPDLDRAMDGRLDWVEVKTDEYVPEFYRKGYQSRKLKARRRIIDVTEPEIDIKSFSTPTSRVPVMVENLGFTPIEDDAEDMRRENETTPEARTQPTLRQTTVTEFMRVRKRRLSEEFCSSDDDDRRPTKSQKTGN